MRRKIALLTELASFMAQRVGVGVSIGIQYGPPIGVQK